MNKFEYRVGWSVNMVGGRGEGDWYPWEGDETTEDDVQEAVAKSTSGYDNSILLETALQDAGFDCWVEAREIGSDDGA